MKDAPTPIYNGAPVRVPLDERGQRIYDGVKSGAFAGVHHELETQVRAFEKTLPAAPVRPRRERASLSERERWMISPHPHRASGARNSEADAKLIQVAHDELSKLGAICTNGSAADGNANPSEQSAFRSARFGGVIR